MKKDVLMNYKGKNGFNYKIVAGSGEGIPELESINEIHNLRNSEDQMVRNIIGPETFEFIEDPRLVGAYKFFIKDEDWYDDRLETAIEAMRNDQSGNKKYAMEVLGLIIEDGFYQSSEYFGKDIWKSMKDSNLTDDKIKHIVADTLNENSDVYAAIYFSIASGEKEISKKYLTSVLGEGVYEIQHTASLLGEYGIATAELLVSDYHTTPVEEIFEEAKEIIKLGISNGTVETHALDTIEKMIHEYKEDKIDELEENFFKLMDDLKLKDYKGIYKDSIEDVSDNMRN